ncbi:estrogen sulfotransferase-like, partial [Acanthaster planci]|uniref:Estrogen sulfotransferase-like n=1 Tax=Acanthaster planci TaxID=133434 RepID=A0A8B7Z7D5_ACAPL
QQEIHWVSSAVPRDEPPKSLQQVKGAPDTYKIVENIPSPRVIKSHLPPQFLPPQLWEKKAKIVYVIRNPKDVVVSYFFFIKMINPQKVDQAFSEFFKEMMDGRGTSTKSLTRLSTVKGRSLPYGPWWDHYLFFWKKRHEPNALLVRFEELKRNVEKISNFLGKHLSAETLDAITEHCTFANMKKNPMSSPDIFFGPPKSATNSGADSATSFMRKGKVGDWKFHFTVAQSEAMDAFIRNKFQGTGMTFDH